MHVDDSDHAISGTYPPGSTFKLVPASGALQEGIISPERLLTARELDQLRMPFDSLAVLGLLPLGEVKVGDDWTPDTWVLQL